MKIVFLDAITVGNDIDYSNISEFGEFITYPTTKPHETYERSKEADIVITNKVVFKKDLLKKLPSLKLICITATGMNNVDLEAAKELGIEVKNVAGYSTYSVTQHTFSLLFYLIGKLKKQDEYVKNLSWSKNGIFTNIDPFFEIRGKKWGIIGLGTIGKEVANVAKSFGCSVSYYSTSGKNNNSLYEQKSLSDLLKSSDIISIHAPLNEKTDNLIRYEELKLLKDGAVFINVGRGGIVNESDLAKILDEKEIFVGLDVTKVEPIEKDNPLLFVKNQDRLFITPHIAWSSKEARVILMQKTYENIKEFLDQIH
jgi:glycerate dehydrogenase